MWQESAPLCSGSSISGRSVAGQASSLASPSQGSMTDASPDALSGMQEDQTKLSSEGLTFQAKTALLKERTAMILGMNPRTLRRKRSWNVYVWPKHLHWALVLQPSGEPFTARVVDDFAHSATECYNAEVPSTQFFLVYELLVDEGDLYLMLSVKPDFFPDRPHVQSLGTLGPTSFLSFETRALAVVACYRSYSFIGCNCQHFATDFAQSLGAPIRLQPDDEAYALAAAHSGATVGVVGACIAAAAGAGAAGAPLVSGAVAPSLAPLILTTIAASATAFSLVGGATLLGVAGLYRVLRDGHRQSSCAMQGGVQALVRSASWPSTSSCEGGMAKAFSTQELQAHAASFAFSECLRPLRDVSSNEDRAEDEGEQRQWPSPEPEPEHEPSLRMESSDWPVQRAWWCWWHEEDS